MAIDPRRLGFLGPLQATVIGWRELRQNKIASARPKDLLDVQILDAHSEN